MQSKRIIQTLLSSEAQSFLTENRGKPTGALALALKKPDIGFDVTVTFNLLSIYNKAAKKNPTWLSLFHPAWTEKSYQQGSSDECARYRTQLIGSKNSLLNLSGGIGIDDYFLSDLMPTITSVELDENVHNLAQFNLEQANCNGVERLWMSAEDYLQTNDLSKFDAFYIDPDRRSGSTSFLLETTSPNLSELQHHLLEYGPVYSKLSPVVDLSYLQERLIHLKEIHVVGLNDEVKEIVTVQLPNYQGPTTVVAVELSSETRKYSGQLTEYQWSNSILNHSFFYVPTTVMAKSGLVQTLAEERQLAVFGSIHFPLLGSNQNQPLPLMKPHQLLGEFPFHKKRWTRSIESLKLKECTLITKGVGLKSASLQQSSGILQSNRFFAYLYRVRGTIRMVVGERLNMR